MKKTIKKRSPISIRRVSLALLILPGALLLPWSLYFRQALVDVINIASYNINGHLVWPIEEATAGAWDFFQLIGASCYIVGLALFVYSRYAATPGKKQR